MLTNLVNGLTVLGNWSSIAYLVGGSLIGMIFGVVPGIGGVVILSITLALINHISLTGAVCAFLGVYAANFFSASVTSILLNMPAHPEAFAITFDGYPMARRGEAGRALGISATATCIGGLIGCAFLVGFIRIISALPLLFKAPDYMALVFIALVLVATLGTNSTSKALISVGIGLMLSTIGPSAITGNYRFTFNAVGLYTGISLVALALGLFSIPQMVLVFGTTTTSARQDMMGRELEDAQVVRLDKGFGRQVIGGIFEAMHHWVLLFVSAVIGVLTGLIPGIGGFTANFLSYGVAKQFSKKSQLFGTGIPEGIIAPEASSLSKEAGGMVPLLGIGIPSGVAGALFIGALSSKGVGVGYGFTKAHPTLAYEMVWVIGLSGLIGTVAGLFCAKFLAKVTRVPGPVLVPYIMCFSILGAFVSDGSFFSVMEVLVFAIVGFVVRRLGYSLAAFVIGLVLGPTLESNIYLTHTVYSGFTFLKRPLSDVLFAVAFLVLIMKSIQYRNDARRERLKAEADDFTKTPEAIRRQTHRRHPYPLMAMTWTLFIAAFSTAFTVYGAIHYPFDAAIMPCIGGALVAASATWRIPVDVFGYIAYRHSRREIAQLMSPVAVASVQTLPDQELVVQAAGGGRDIRAGDVIGSDALGVSDVHRVSGTENPPGSSLLDESQNGQRRFAAVQIRSWGIHGQYTREIIGFAWLLALVGGCFVFGFNIGVPAFCFAYGVSALRRNFPGLTARLIFATATAVVMWGIDFEMLNILHFTLNPLVHF